MKSSTKLTVNRKLIADIVSEFPKLSKHALAELLMQRYPAMFKDEEDARFKIRYYTGSAGKHHRKSIHSSKVKHNTLHSTTNPYGLPNSECKQRVFKKIPTRFDKILWMSDIHLPNHDIAAVTAAIKKGKEDKVNCIVLGGDILDNEPFTNHDAPLPGLGDVRKWFEMCQDFLKTLKKQFPDAKFYWLEGNHDRWYMRYLMKKAPAIFGDAYYELKNRLALDDLNIEFLDEHIILQAGKLHLLHGHTLIRGFIAPVNSARGLFLRTKSSTLIGHVHNSSYHPESNLKGEKIGCWSVGCLCTLAPDYDPHNTKHNQGFAIIYTRPDGTFTVNNYTIHNGKVL